MPIGLSLRRHEVVFVKQIEANVLEHRQEAVHCMRILSSSMPSGCNSGTGELVIAIEVDEGNSSLVPSKGSFTVGQVRQLTPGLAEVSAQSFLECNVESPICHNVSTVRSSSASLGSFCVTAGKLSSLSFLLFGISN